MAFNLQVDAGTTANANGYIDVAFYKSYHSDRGIIVTQGNGKIEENIILATDFLDHNYLFKGARLLTTQTTEWPRKNAFDDLAKLLSGLPTKLKEACAEITKVGIVNGSIYLSPTTDDSGREIKRKTETVGAISESTEFFAPSEGVGDIQTYPIDKALSLLEELIFGGGFGSQKEAIVV